MQLRTLCTPVSYLAGDERRCGTQGWGKTDTKETHHSLQAPQILLPPSTSEPHAVFFFLIYLFLAALGLRCCTRAFSSSGERGLLFVAVRRLLIVVASLVAEHGLQVRGLQ